MADQLCNGVNNVLPDKEAILNELEREVKDFEDYLPFKWIPPRPTCVKCANRIEDLNDVVRIRILTYHKHCFEESHLIHK